MTETSPVRVERAFSQLVHAGHHVMLIAVA